LFDLAPEYLQVNAIRNTRKEVLNWLKISSFFMDYQCFEMTQLGFNRPYFRVRHNVLQAGFCLGLVSQIF